MIYNDNRVKEAIYIYEQITMAKNLGAKTVEVSDVNYDENIKTLMDIGYKVTNTKNGIKIEWKEI